MTDSNLCRVRKEKIHRHEEVVKFCFEGCKYMAILSSVTVGFLITIYTGKIVKQLPIVVAVVTIGLCVLLSLFGMMVSLGNFKYIKDKLYPMRVFFAAVAIYAFGVSSLLVAVLGLPQWVIFPEVVAALAAFFYVTRRKSGLMYSEEGPAPLVGGT